MNRYELIQLQKLPLEIKIEKTKLKIREWYEKFAGDVYISFSGGKDSTVLLDLVRNTIKEFYNDNVEAVFCDTQLEYPELREHIKTIDNVKIIKPKMNFREVIDKYGYPLISKEISQKIYQMKNYNLSDRYKDYLINGNEKGTIGMIPKKWQFLINENIKISSACCDVMKKRPFHAYEKMTNKKAYVGTLAHESQQRTQQYLRYQCNHFECKKQVSTPLGFWVEQDILQYIDEFKLTIPSVYGNLYFENNKYKLSGVNRTGCIFCLYGIHREKYPNRIQKLEITHKKLYDYCINNLGLKNVLELINVPYKRPRLQKYKYSIRTKKIDIRISKKKFETIKSLYANLTNTELVDSLLKEFENEKISKEINIKKSNKYKIETVKISCRVDLNLLIRLKNRYNTTSNTILIDLLISKKIKSVGQILNHGAT